MAILHLFRKWYCVFWGANIRGGLKVISPSLSVTQDVSFSQSHRSMASPHACLPLNDSLPPGLLTWLLFVFYLKHRFLQTADPSWSEPVSFTIACLFSPRVKGQWVSSVWADTSLPLFMTVFTTPRRRPGASQIPVWKERGKERMQHAGKHGHDGRHRHKMAATWNCTHKWTKSGP